MKDIAITIGCMIVASIGATYIIREIESDFWRTQHYYGRAKKAFTKKFK